MRIGIDARTINVYPGMGRHCYSLTKALAKIDQENEYVIFKTPKASMPLTDNPNFEEVTVDIRPLSVGSVIGFSRHVAKAKLDMLLCGFYIAPWNVPCKMVLTVYDMMDRSFAKIFSHHPFPIPLCLKLFYRIVVRRAVRNATRIITISEFTKREVLKYHRLKAEHIYAIHLAADTHFRPEQDITVLQRVRERYHLPSDYVLFLGTTKYYKNLDRLMESFALMMRKDMPSRPMLVVAGMKDALGSRLLQLVRRLEIENDVLFIGEIDEDDMPALYSLATVFAFPSLYEGFGLPPLEAMSCGTPVIVSNTSSLPEVVGEGGVQIDPFNTEEMARALEKMLTDDSHRKAMSDKGLRQAANFSWEKTAQETLNVLKLSAQEERLNAETGYR